MRLENNVTLICGAGTNMSRAIALLFAQEGAKIVLAARSKVAMEETARSIHDAGGEALSYQADLTDERAVAGLAEAAIERFGGVDCFIHSAGGYYSSEHDVTNMHTGTWDDALRNNLRTLFLPAKELVPTMTQRGGGTIITLTAGLRVRQDANSAYAAAKAGMIGTVVNLAKELYPKNIRAHAICPGIMWDPLPDGPVHPLAPQLERLGNPIDVAYCALWLCSDEASWVTGQVITIDGGDSVFIDSPSRRAAVDQG